MGAVEQNCWAPGARDTVAFFVPDSAEFLYKWFLFKKSLYQTTLEVCSILQSKETELQCVK